MDNNRIIEEEFNFKRAFFNILYHIKPLVIVGIVFSILLGFYKGIKTYNSLKMTEEQYATAIENYNTKKSTIEENISNLKTQIAEQQNYIDNSIFMKINSNEFARIRGKFIFSPTDEMASVSKVMSYLTRYLDVSLYQISDENNVDVKLIEELVSFVPNDEKYSYSITIIGNDEEFAFDLYEKVENYLYEFCDTVLLNSVDFSVSRVEFTNSIVSDVDVKDIQKRAVSTLNDYKTQLTEQQKSLNELIYPDNNKIKSISIKEVLKYAVIGFALGLVLGAIWLTVKDLCINSIYDEDDIRAHGLSILGVFESGSNYSNIEKALRSLEGKPINNENTMIDYLKANVAFYSKNAKKLLITSSMTGEKEKKYADIINGINGVEVAIAGDILKDSSAVIKLIESDAVIFIVEAGNTSLSDFKNQIKKVKDFNKNIIGVILEE